MLTARIQELEDNRRAGEQQLRALETKQRELQQTLLRIGGAIQALTELRDELRQQAAPGDGQA
ncbi:hypothetical protein [Burkholderia gladioli]|nr:hypothetical protein [Burkholderia gladioli]NIF72318.1 hypothetical protein [Burkholderia sp. Ap-962]NIF93279.1 hypothetical protein [Burkholderia sp. Cy-637]MBU9169774.1 hypothetical protein [Burkholderia gladioli]MBU9425303.1 hypothetical protein [Burkholderia gladioli]PEH82364.1 hypothetical protein CRM95_30300 [Burkholderia gladioli]